MAQSPRCTIRPCAIDDTPRILAIINEASTAYRGVIPDDRWHEPYMSVDELRHELASGVRFVGMEIDGTLAGIMGLQTVDDVDLIRHAYVASDHQQQGIGGALLDHLARQRVRPMLVGTWAAASWAIAFYQRNGFELVDPAAKDALLARYWKIPTRQAEVSVVLRQRDS